MEKPKNGLHSFLPAGENTFPQPCIVVATYEDNTANLVTWDENGKESVIRRAVLVQESTDEAGCCVPCHYALPVT